MSAAIHSNAPTAKILMDRPQEIRSKRNKTTEQIVAIGPNGPKISIILPIPSPNALVLATMRAR